MSPAAKCFYVWRHSYRCWWRLLSATSAGNWKLEDKKGGQHQSQRIFIKNKGLNLKFSWSCLWWICCWLMIGSFNSHILLMIWAILKDPEDALEWIVEKTKRKGSGRASVDVPVLIKLKMTWNDTISTEKVKNVPFCRKWRETVFQPPEIHFSKWLDSN